MSKSDPIDDLARALFEAAQRDQPAADVVDRVLRDSLGRLDVSPVIENGGADPSPESRQRQQLPSGDRTPATRWNIHVAVAVAAAVVVIATLLVGRSARDPLLAIGPENASARRAPDVASPEGSTDQPIPSAAITPPLPSEQSPAKVRAHSSTPARPAESAATARTPATLGEELQVLDRARAALTAGDTTAALREIDVYEHVLNGTRLSEEATLVRIEALTRSGRATAAVGLAQSFIDAHPGSPLVDRARALVGLNLSGVSKVDAGGTK